MPKPPAGPGKPGNPERLEADLDRAAIEIRPQERRIEVDAASYQRYVEILNRPPSGEGFARLMSAAMPWTKEAKD